MYYGKLFSNYAIPLTGRFQSPEPSQSLETQPTSTPATATIVASSTPSKAAIIATFRPQPKMVNNKKKVNLRIPKKNVKTKENKESKPTIERGRRDRNRGRGRKRKEVPRNIVSSENNRKRKESSRKSISFTKVKRLKLSLEVVQVYHMDGDRERTYFEGPYEVESDGIIVGEGKLVCYHKADIAEELRRQFDFYCHAYLQD